MKIFISLLTLSLFLHLSMEARAEEQGKESLGSGEPASNEKQPAPANPPKESSRKSDDQSMVPTFDPDGEIVTWNGQIWNIHNNRAVRARLEKYLNEPPQTAEDDKAYRSLMESILQKLSPENLTKGAQVDEAWGLMFKASEYPNDANLSASTGEAVYAIWLGRQEQERVSRANAAMQREQENLTSNLAMESASRSLGEKAPRDQAEARIWAEQQQQQRQIRMSPYMKRMEELDAKYKANLLKNEVAQVEAKIQYQSLVVQLFALRRFEHVLIASRFYRSVFGDGDNKLNVGDEVKSLFGKGTGAPPTLTVVDTLAKEAISDVEKGVQAYLYLMEQGELDSAIKRLTESYAVGEHLPVIQTLSREQKRMGLSYLQKSNGLLAALEVKDYAEAEKLVEELRVMAKDFVPTKPTAAIRAGKTMSDMHLAKAQVAAGSGNKEAFEEELQTAAELWPANPKLVQLSELVFGQANEQQQAQTDLQRLIAQKSYREIFDNKVRYIAASAMLPEKQKELGVILEKMQKVEIAMAQSAELAKRGDFSGAWEGVELAYLEVPSDNKLNQLRAEYTVKAYELVRSLQNAKAIEDKGEYGSSLAWYLKSRSLYPPSSFAKEGIDRIIEKSFSEKNVIPEEMESSVSEKK
jgi:hypothetical protein